MNPRTKFFGMTVQERSAFFARSDVKDFIQRVRDLGHQKRAITGSDLLIPEIVLGLIRENIQNYSKLYKHVNVRSVPGNAADQHGHHPRGRVDGDVRQAERAGPDLQRR